MLVAVQLSVPGLYLAAGVRISAVVVRPRRSFHCRSTPPCERLGPLARWSCWWLSNYLCPDCICRQCLKSVKISGSAPDDHFTAGPDCRVRVSRGGRVGDASRCPTIGAGIVSAASVQRIDSRRHRPRRSFHCRSTPPCERYRAAGALVVAGSCPTIRSGIVSSASIQEKRCHQLRPTRSFHCRSTPPYDWIRASGALVVLVAVQLSVLGLYLPPVFNGVRYRCLRPRRSSRCPSTLPCESTRAAGALL